MRNKFYLPLSIIITILLVLTIAETFAQQSKIDSLLMLVKADKIACSPPCARDSNIVNHQLDLAKEYTFRNPDSAIILAQQALHLAEKINLSGKQAGWQKGIGASYNLMGTLHLYKGDYTASRKFYNKALEVWELMEKNADLNPGDTISKFLVQKYQASTLANIGVLYSSEGNYPTALEYFFKVLKIQEKSRDKIRIANVLNSIGSAYKKQGEYPKALDFYFRSEKLYEETGNKVGISSILCNIGSVYYYQKNYPKTLEYYLNSLKMAEELGDKNLISTCIANLGSVYYNQNNYSKALEFDLRSLKMAEELGDKNIIAICLNKIGNVYSSQNDKSKALDYYLKALKMEEELGDKEQIASCLGNIGNTYKSMKKNGEAENYLLQALAISDSIGALDLKKDQYDNLSELYQQTGNYKKALEYYQKASVVKDSLFNEEKEREITRKEMNYEFEQKETIAKADQDKKDVVANAEIKRQKLIKNTTLGSVGVAGIFSFILVWSFNRRRKTAFEKQVSQVEMTALRAQMNPHFIFNSLHSINKYVIDNDKNNASDYLTKFARLMRLILENSREQEVPLEKDLSALELYMQLESLRFQNKFQYNIEVDPQIDQENVLITPLLLQPFVENSILHGLRTKENGRIQIKIKKEENMIRCSVEDNGIGRQQTVQVESGQEKKRESLGMKITQERLNIINQLKKVKAAVNIFDLKDADNKPGGLRVELMLPFETAF